MRSTTRIVGSGVLVLGILLAAVYWFRMPVMVHFVRLMGVPPLEVQANVELGTNEEWIDDYYTIERIDDDTFAISEARYFRDVHMYLLVGEERALLIDSGSRNRDLSEIVARLTEKPVTAIATHLHFDHTGNHDRFERVAMPDTLDLRARVADDGVFTPSSDEFLGAVEGFDAISWTVTEWWKPGSVLDLGGRRLELIETPGHTRESISIWESSRNALYMGDHSGDGEIYAFMPTSSLQAYLDSTRDLITRLPIDSVIYAAHGAAKFAGVPITGQSNLSDLENALVRMRDGSSSATGLFPRVYTVNSETNILTDLKAPNSLVWDFR